MNSRIPPRYVVQSLSSQASRRRLWLILGGAWVVSLLLVAAVVSLMAGHGSLAVPGNRAGMAALRAENDQLRQQVATLTQSAQVARVASEALKKTLADRDEEINGLRTDQAFYAHLIGGGALREGLRVQDIHLKALPEPRAWNFTVTLTQNTKRGKETTGAMHIAIDGILNGHLTRVGWDRIGNSAQKDGINFDFKYFEQLHGSLMLPANFIPNRLHVTVTAKGGRPIVSSVAWSDALKSVESNDVQQ